MTTLQFQALAETEVTEVYFLAEWPSGDAVTRVRRLDLTDVTGDISATSAVTVVTCGTADADADEDVDLADFAAFQRCFSSEGATAEALCQCLFDSEPDGDVDLADFQGFAQGLSGPLP